MAIHMAQAMRVERSGHELRGGETGETGEDIMQMHMTPSVGLSLLIDFSPVLVNAILL